MSYLTSTLYFLEQIIATAEIKSFRLLLSNEMMPTKVAKLFHAVPAVFCRFVRAKAVENKEKWVVVVYTSELVRA